MPALANIRHERFARAYIRTGNAAASYLKAGYAPTTRESLDPAASKLTRSNKVAGRIRELQAQAAKRNAVTVDTLIDELAADRALARRLGQPSAAIQATMLTAKLVGLLVDRKETGRPGECVGLQSESEVLARVRSELGEDCAETLAAALAQQDQDDPPGHPA
jgi:hypothetical protein